MPTVPRPPPTAERQKEYDRIHDAGRALYGVVTEPYEVEPLTYKKHSGVWHDKEHPFQRQGEWFTVWREPNGRFARRPAHGERAKRLNLPEDNLERPE